MVNIIIIYEWETTLLIHTLIHNFLPSVYSSDIEYVNAITTSHEMQLPQQPVNNVRVSRIDQEISSPDWAITLTSRMEDMSGNVWIENR